eukprot:NODE_244_length_11882_cov_0.560214.p9 type:complete len:167 gc:universal NODE_244_length_11882_cov_0.560214:8173-8673(+)
MNCRFLQNIARIPAADVMLHSSNLEKLRFYALFSMEACQAFGAKSALSPLPRKMKYYTVLKSAFKFKQAQETYEKRTFRRLIKIYNTHPETANQLLYYLNDNTPDGVKMKSHQYFYEDENVLKRIDDDLELMLKNNRAWIPFENEVDPNVAALRTLKALKQNKQVV